MRVKGATEAFISWSSPNTGPAGPVHSVEMRGILHLPEPRRIERLMGIFLHGNVGITHFLHAAKKQK